ncbi:hypothetical protein MMC09_003854, partial [Bachmanniomyces sp. S44760]|nr:hypothetical protein [Bachmanniomyces sp. S44760]
MNMFYRWRINAYKPCIQIYVIATQGEIYSRGLAVLHALHRAVISSPETLPNIEFVLSTDDKLPPLPIWSFARERNDDVTWLMPDFGFWSWPETHVGSYGEIQRKALEMEDTSDNPSEKSWPWARKKDQLFWRGATMGLGLRDKFIESTINKTWADVKAIQWHDSTSMGSDLKSMDEHCQYKYLAHTEGNSYSGRLKYLQNCRSVIVAHTMEWVQHYTPLMIASGARQNFVEVQRDFSDLESTMLSLQKNDRKAAMIAGNSVSIFRERYLTPAAEACYWRRLIRGWAEVTPEPSPWTINNTTSTRNWRGIPVESYLLERRLTWDP